MSKMSDMSMTIEELRNAAVAINDAANWLAQQEHPMLLNKQKSLLLLRNVH